MTSGGGGGGGERVRERRGRRRRSSGAVSGAMRRRREKATTVWNTGSSGLEPDGGIVAGDEQGSRKNHGWGVIYGFGGEFTVGRRPCYVSVQVDGYGSSVCVGPDQSTVT